MKIALVTEWLDAWRGGAERSTLQFLHHLRNTDVDLHVFTRSRPSPTPGMAVHTISGAAMSRTRQSVTFARRVERLLQRDSFDVVHAISPCRGADLYQPRGGTVAESIERNLALRRNATARSVKRQANRLNFKQRYLLGMEKALFRDPNGPTIVAISDYVVDQLKRHYTVPDQRIRKIYNGVDLDGASAEERDRDRRAIRREFGVSERDCLVLLIAHNFRLKGIQRWMEAQAEFVKRGDTEVRSIVIGKGDSQHWHRLASRLGINDRLTFVGPSDRVPAFHHAADALVHPTYYDPCSRVVLEAMAAGLPCITTRWDGASEMIEDGRNGYIVDDPWDVAALANRVDRLRDVDHRQALGRAAKAIADRVSMARHAQEIRTLYRQLANLASRS